MRAGPLWRYHSSPMLTTPRSPSLFTMQVLWGALIVTPGLYTLILVVTQKAEAAAQGPDAVLVAGISACALFVAALSVALPRVMARRRAERSEPATRDDQTYADQGDHGFREAATATTTRVLADPAAAEAAAFRTGYAPFIVGMALAEAVANFGFTLGFLGGGLRLAGPFFAVCVALQAVRFPTRAGVLARYEEAVGARFPRG